MRFSRTRYVTLCQQSLVTAAVLAVGLSAAGVKTLDIVPQPGASAGTAADTLDSAPHGGAGASSLPQALAQPDPGESEVATAPVTPKVREVSVTSPPKREAARQAPTGNKQQEAPADPGYVETTPQKVEGYATIGVTWKHGVTYGDDEISIEVRTEDKGAWSKWMDVDYHDDHGPDGASSEEESARERPGTDALVIGDVDQVQMRARTTDGSVPPELRLAIIDPGTGGLVKQAPAIDTAKLPSATKPDADESGPQASGTTTLEGDGVQDTVTLSAMNRPAKPYIYSRKQWGANEKMREQSAPGYGTVRTGFVHHTVNANNYTAAQVPSLMRGIYAYHTQSRGWRDIGYNYLVDRFGRIWEGRWGGVDRAVVGAHTLGYNEVSFAMSAIGNFDVARPPTAVLNAFARLFAWKLALYNIPANRTGIAVKGRKLRAINGHRDVGQTACPGRYLYAQLPYIRTQATKIQGAAPGGGGGTTPPPTTPKPTPVFTSPTQKALPAKAQPKTVRFPRTLNLSGAPYADVVLRGYGGLVKVLETGGQMGYRTVGITPGPWGKMSILTAVNDVTGDGKGDVLGRLGGGATKIYRGNGAGRVSRVGIAATKIFRRANKVVAAGDFNGDRRNDVLMRQWSNGGLYLVRGLGGGRFATPRLLAMGWKKYSSIAVPGDVTGDRRPDVVGVKAGRMYVFPNVRGLRIGRATSSQYVGSGYSDVVGGGRDINGGGVGDLLVRNRSNGAIGVRLGQSKGPFGTALGPFGSAARWTRISAGQMAGTLQTDFVGVGPRGRGLVVKANNGLRNVKSLVTTNLKLPDASMVLNAGDWNGDRKGDIIARDTNKDRLVLYPGRGGGKYAAGVVMSTGWRTFVNLAVVGDVTGDGRPDLMGRVEGGRMTIFPSAGGAKFRAPILAPAAMRTFNQIGAGYWRTASMPGTSYSAIGAFYVPSVSVKGKIPSPYNRVVGPGDVDGDGRPDLIARDSAGVLWLLPGAGSGYGTRRYIAAGFKGFQTMG